MFTGVTMENFKSWKNVETVPLGPLSGFFGTNSSGKTSLLQALLLMKQTSESTDRKLILDFGTPTSYVHLGSFREAVFSHDERKALRFGFTWKLLKRLEVADPSQQPGKALFVDDQMSFETRVGQSEAGELSVDEIVYQFAKHDFSLKRKGTGLHAYTLSATPGDFRFVRGQGRPWDLPEPFKCYGFPDQVKAYYQNAAFLSDLELELEDQLDRTYYLGPLREYPRREYLWAGARPDDVGRRGERSVEALLAARLRGEKISRGKGIRRQTLEAYIADWLRKLKLIHEFRVEEISKGSNLFRVRVKQSPGSAEALITDVGFGVSQILPVLVLLYYVPEGSTVLLEQPEIHLHPSVQAGLADVILDAIQVRRIQVLLESHSEHLLRRLLRRVAEGEISTDDTALYFCQIKDGESKLHKLEVDMFGTIHNWPDNFFGDEFGEIAATQEAGMRRRLKSEA
jgi:predicted ATPase